MSVGRGLVTRYTRAPRQDIAFYYRGPGTGNHMQHWSWGPYYKCVIFLSHERSAPGKNDSFVNSCQIFVDNAFGNYRPRASPINTLLLVEVGSWMLVVLWYLSFTRASIRQPTSVNITDEREAWDSTQHLFWYQRKYIQNKCGRAHESLTNSGLLVRNRHGKRRDIYSTATITIIFSIKNQ